MNSTTIRIVGVLSNLRDSDKNQYADFDFMGGSIQVAVPLGTFTSDDYRHTFDFTCSATPANLPLVSRNGSSYNLTVFKANCSHGFLAIKRLD